MANTNKETFLLPVDCWLKSNVKEDSENKFSFAWTIEDFSNRQEETGVAIHSTSFTKKFQDGGEIQWKFRLYPKGIVSRHFLSLFLDYESHSFVKENFL